MSIATVTPPTVTPAPAPAIGPRRFRLPRPKLPRLRLPRRDRRVKTPTLIQMEAVECGAAALGIVLGYYGRRVPLEELRLACGVSRDGSKASNMVRAARTYGMTAKGFRKEPEQLWAMRLPLIVFWNFNHFVVLEGRRGNKVYLNDPATGPRVVSYDEFDQSFTGVVLACEPGPEFRTGGPRRNILAGLSRRLAKVTPSIAYLIMVGIGLTITGLIIPAFSRVFVDEILVGGQDWILGLLVGMALTVAVKAALTWLQQYTLLRLETRLSLSSSSGFLWHVMRLPVEFFTQRYPGDISSRVGINDEVSQLLAGPLATAALNVFIILFYVVLMLQYDVLLTLVGVAMVFINVFTMRAVSRKIVDDNQRLVTEQGKLVGTTISGLQTIETIKATGAEGDFFARWAGHQAKVLNMQQRVGSASMVLTAVPPFLMAFTTAAVLGLGGLRVMEGALTMGMLVAFQSLMSSFLSPVNQMVSLGTTVQAIEGDMNRLDDVLRYRTDPLLDAPSARRNGARQAVARRDGPHQNGVHQNGTAADSGARLIDGGARLAGYLELKDVSFGYSRLEAPLIDKLSLSLKPGDRVALVGGSGSGKSTVAKLVAGLYEPWEGELLFDGRPRSEIPREVMTGSLAMVDQDIFMFEGTIRENLTLWDLTVPQADVIRAARDAAIHDDVAARNGGYDHVIDEGGRNFSGGQRQRLEIARALATNPTILVLDEATSALDAVTEQKIDRELRRRGCTCLVVAHRLSTIRDCDEIIVLDRGKVVQRGTHEAMSKVDGPYARLIRSEDYSQDRRVSVLERL